MTSHSAARGARPYVALAAILAVAAALRFWGVAFGLPHTQARPDETQIIDVTRQFLAGNLHPQFFDYPWLYMWISTALYLGYFAVGWLAGWFHSVADLLASWPVHWEPFFLINRVLSATIGSLSVLVAYGIGRRLSDKHTGLIAALLLALTFIHGRDSHFGTTDAMMTALVMLSTMWLIDGHESRSRRAFVLAGIAGGLATATKYNAGVIMFPVLVSQLVDVLQSRRFDGRMFWFGVPCAAAFLIGVPFLIFDYAHFREAMVLLDASMRSGTGPMSDGLGNGWLHHLRYSLFYGVGWPVLALGVAGAGVALWRRPGLALAVLTFPLVYFYVIGSVRNLFFRYALPMVPFFCVLAAVAIAAIAARITRAHARTAAIAWGLAVVAVAPSAWSLIQFDRIAARTDNRVVVARWFDDNIPAGATIAQSGSGYGYVQFTPGRFDPWLWDGGRRIFTTLRRQPAEGRPDYILLQESPIPSSTQAQITAWLQRGYEPVQQFKALTINRPRVYDLQDAFYIPFADFDGVTRPGPNFTLYHRVY